MHTQPHTDGLPLTRRQALQAGAGLIFAPSVLGLPGYSGAQAEEQDENNAIREFTFNASRFEGAPDGRSREIWGYNGEFPGPLIRATEGETIRVRLVNDLGTPTSSHWHGMRQWNTWRMDGVTTVSADPIPDGKEFTYEFKADPAGTHWYHSHTGLQYSEGLFGPLIIDRKEETAKYDREKILMINDWFLQSSDQIFKKIQSGAYMDKEKPGKPDVGDVPFESFLLGGRGRMPGDTKTPLSSYEVEKGEVVRFRIINASSTYGFRLQFDGHPVTVIEADGQLVSPIEVDNLFVHIGQRYDLLLKADGEGVAWIRAVTQAGDEGRAILRYKGASAVEPADAPVRWGSKALTPSMLRAPQPVSLAANPTEIEMVLGGSMMPYRWTMGGQSYPDADPIVVQKGESVRMRLVNPTGMDHPFHLHGHWFSILGSSGALNTTDPVARDTVSVPRKGDVVIQTVLDNPGKWFFHCHIEWHLGAGMARVIEVRPYK